MTAAAAPFPRYSCGVRALGMGGAFTAVADDESAIFYNPAGLAGQDFVAVSIFNPLIDIGSDSLDLIGDAADVDFNSTEETADLMRDYVGEYQYIRCRLFPHAAFNVADVGAMVGVLGQFRLEADVWNPVWPELYVDRVTDYGLMGGMGWKLPFTGLKAGWALKLLAREHLQAVYTATDISADDFEDRLADDTVSGSGVTTDFGVMYTKSLVPLTDLTLAVAVQHFPELDFGDAPDLKTQVNLGAGLHTELMGLGVIVAADLMDITNEVSPDDDVEKKLHLGVEAHLPAVASVRMGLNQGYFTAGVTLSFRLIRLEVATYAEEVGTDAVKWDNRRYVCQLSLGW